MTESDIFLASLIFCLNGRHLYLCVQDILQYNSWYELTSREICNHISKCHGTQLGPYFGDLITSEPPYSNTPSWRQVISVTTNGLSESLEGCLLQGFS